jgi:RNA polymerase sigma-70 factor, ECF subfamily
LNFEEMGYKNYNDEELIKMLNGDDSKSNEAFNIIFIRHMSQLFGYCLYKSENRDDAEELMQETWIRFYNSIRAGKTTNNILALLFTIARNLSINNYNQRQRKKNQFSVMNYDNLDFESIADSYNIQFDMEHDELVRILEIAVNSLDEIYKETVLLYWFGEMSFKEIAEVCGEKEDCIRRRYDRAAKKLHVIMEPYLV